MAGHAVRTHRPILLYEKNRRYGGVKRLNQEMEAGGASEASAGRAPDQAKSFAQASFVKCACFDDYLSCAARICARARDS